MTHVAIIGAGPAGLTAAYELRKAGVSVTVLEKDPQYVGGISRTEEREGFKFDIGGHRFFSKSREIMAFWEDILGDQFLTRPRKSRIYYGKKFYPYPLQALPTLKNMGVLNAGLCVLSYLKAKCMPIKEVVSFEDYIINHFGRRLYLMFFKTYTEKVWGMPCNSIAADWAAQRIKGLSLSSAIIDALGFHRLFKPKNTIKTLITTFQYPKYGPGQMWEVLAEKITALGGNIVMDAEVTSIMPQPDGSYQLQSTHSATPISADHVISSMPMRQLVEVLGPKVPEHVITAATSLAYRDFLTVALVVRDTQLFDDNWIYIHEPDVNVGRVQNFKSWSPYLVPDPSLNCLGMEYFCFEGDGLWSSTDEALVALASNELVALELATPDDIIKGFVVRQPKAYPVYDQFYEQHVDTIKHYAQQALPNVHFVGRAGMHKYNNQDHAMMTAMLTAKNIVAGSQVYDVWEVNQDAEYHEEASTSGERLVPRPIR